jgi:hypothetical protein
MEIPYQPYYAFEEILALIGEGEADHQVIGHVHGADLGTVGQPGPAVDQHALSATRPVCPPLCSRLSSA